MASVDEARLGEFMNRMIGYMTGGAACFAIWLGDELGLYTALAGAGPSTAQAVAARAACNPRLVREWLDAQVAGGLVDYDATADTYSLSPEAAMALADDTSPVLTLTATVLNGNAASARRYLPRALIAPPALAWLSAA